MVTLKQLEARAAKATGDYFNLNSDADAHKGLNNQPVPPTKTVELIEDPKNYPRRASGDLAESPQNTRWIAKLMRKMPF